MCQSLPNDTLMSLGWISWWLTQLWCTEAWGRRMGYYTCPETTSMWLMCLTLCTILGKRK